MLETFMNLSVLQIRNHEQLAKNINEELAFITQISLRMFEIENVGRVMISKLNNLIEGLQTLNAGFLSPYLITPEMLRRGLNWVANNIRETSTKTTAAADKLSIVHMEPEFYYKRMTFLAQRFSNAHTLFITIKVPLTPFDDSFKLYEVRTFPQPLPNSTDHVTIIRNLPYAVAVTSNRDAVSTSKLENKYPVYYVLSEHEFNQLHHAGSEPILYEFRSSRSCVMAIL